VDKLNISHKCKDYWETKIYIIHWANLIILSAVRYLPIQVTSYLMPLKWFWMKVESKVVYLLDDRCSTTVGKFHFNI